MRRWVPSTRQRRAKTERCIVSSIETGYAICTSAIFTINLTFFTCCTPCPHRRKVGASYWRASVRSLVGGKAPDKTAGPSAPRRCPVKQFMFSFAWVTGQPLTFCSGLICVCVRVRAKRAMVSISWYMHCIITDTTTKRVRIFENEFEFLKIISSHIRWKLFSKKILYKKTISNLHKHISNFSKSNNETKNCKWYYIIFKII